MRKRGEYQRRKERQNRVSNILLTMLLLLIMLLFTYSLIQHAVNVHDINHDSLQEYTGSYELSEKRSAKSRLTYVFTLDNGDAVNIGARWIENEDLLESNPNLTFHYTTMSTTVGGNYSAVSIVSADGNGVLVSAERMKSESIGMIWISSAILLVDTALLAVMLMLSRTKTRRK